MARRGGGVVDRAGLENRSTCKRTEGSNPSLSAIYTSARAWPFSSLREGEELSSQDVGDLILAATSSGAKDGHNSPLLQRPKLITANIENLLQHRGCVLANAWRVTAYTRSAVAEAKRRRHQF
jgi:hypothetical protein